VYRAVDQYGQIIDVQVSKRRDGEAARRFFRRALTTLKVRPTEVVTDAAPVYPGVIDELVPAAWHHLERYANNRIEADHGRLKRRLRPMRGLRTDCAAQVIISGLTFLRIFAAATTNSRPKHHADSESPQRSSSWRKRSNRPPTEVHHARRRDYATAPIHRSRWPTSPP
jgi:transposase-like protein